MPPCKVIMSQTAVRNQVYYAYCERCLPLPVATLQNLGIGIIPDSEGLFCGSSMV